MPFLMSRPFLYLMSLMKIIHTSMLLPIILGGCSLQHRQPTSSDSDALQFVDAQIQTNTQIIVQAQNTLKQASTMTQRAHSPTSVSSPARPLSTTNANKGQASPASIRGLKNVKSLGTPGAFTLVSRASQNQPIETVLRQIVPQGWSVEFSADLKAISQKRIHLNANDQWPYVLDSLLIQNQLVALINWPTQKVSIARWTESFNSARVATPSPAKTGNTPASTKPTVAVPAAKTAGPHNPFSASRQATTIVSTTTPVSQSAIKPVATPKVWQAKTGSTLKDTLFLWAANEKCIKGDNDTWRVAWMTDVNYRIDAPLSFSGPFREALNDVFHLYTTAAVPLYAGISTTQCLIEVDDKEVR